MIFRFNSSKNTKLIQERDIGFEEIIVEISEGRVLTSEIHPNSKKYPNQRIFHVRIKKEIYVVPYILEKEGTIFLKTIFPSRKARKKFSGNNYPQ